MEDHPAMKALSDQQLPGKYNKCINADLKPQAPTLAIARICILYNKSSVRILYLVPS